MVEGEEVIKVGDKVLVTVDNWFHAPDGRSYRSVFGTVKAISGDQETLGIRTNARATNWYATIGNVLIAGCQIHYALNTEECNTGDVEDCSEINGEIKFFRRPSYIYRAD